MGRPRANRDGVVTANENSIARARDRQAQCVKADRDLRDALHELGEAETDVVAAEQHVVALHTADEKLSRELRNENLSLNKGVA